MSDAADRFRATSEGFLARLTAVRPDQWDNPTPCPDWTVRDVAVHVINEQRRTLAQVRGIDPEPLHGVSVAEMGSLPETTPDADLAAAWKHIGNGLAEAIDDPACLDTAIPTFQGPTPFREIVGILPEDVLIHTWDLARGIGGDERLNQDVVTYVYNHLRPLDEALRQPWAFGPKLTPPPHADLQTQFLCFVGRHP
ncbi:TIGR03086 family metal-binding protein [Nocardia sp. NPDC006044]|uniref:TIGR03086 family metal-binding protein n=1 Tax=Nocardia sp. NPDC006044 TaxID=3364306 RepID=UPI0036A4B23E